MIHASSSGLAPAARILGLAFAAACTTGCDAQPVGPEPETEPPPASAPVETQPHVEAPAETPTGLGPEQNDGADPGAGADDPVVGLLRDAQAQLRSADALRVRLRLDRQLPLGLDQTTRFGELLFARPTAGGAEGRGEVNPRFDVRFTGLVTGGEGAPLEPIDERFVFDGRVLLEVDTVRKLATVRELARPGERIDLESNGFVPLPLDLDADRLAQTRLLDEVGPDDALDDHTLHQEADGQSLRAVRIRPKPGGEDGKPAPFASLILLIDTERNLPQQVEVVEPGGDVVRVRLFLAKSLELDPPLKPEAFDTRPPRGREWQIDAVPLDAGG
ncbi:MAG: hypothetical protein AAF612_03830 [Planctomycetota bacterium]